MAGTYTKLFYHIVFSTKHRSELITPAIELELHKYIAGIVRGIDGSCVEINGMPDHVHLLAILPPKIALSDALREIKANSSKWVHETKPDLAKFGWQDGYAAFTVSKSAGGIGARIHSQSEASPRSARLQSGVVGTLGQTRGRI